ncbi:Hypothetical_protein [Hexamita inflata]|uniref:Hypothetical_protein n=1 Tax=Hexamita inflata TaxID=28002 RepID=A0AA86QH65_9EUKA|nr:Hypothetical protein HINF_LOCUS45823 [Hexamita inflata]
MVYLSYKYSLSLLFPAVCVDFFLVFGQCVFKVFLFWLCRSFFNRRLRGYLHHSFFVVIKDFTVVALYPEIRNLQKYIILEGIQKPNQVNEQMHQRQPPTNNANTTNHPVQTEGNNEQRETEKREPVSENQVSESGKTGPLTKVFTGWTQMMGCARFKYVNSGMRVPTFCFHKSHYRSFVLSRK